MQMWEHMGAPTAWELSTLNDSASGAWLDIIPSLPGKSLALRLALTPVPCEEQVVIDGGPPTPVPRPVTEMVRRGGGTKVAVHLFAAVAIITVQSDGGEGEQMTGTLSGGDHWCVPSSLRGDTRGRGVYYCQRLRYRRVEGSWTLDRPRRWRCCSARRWKLLALHEEWALLLKS